MAVQLEDYADPYWALQNLVIPDMVGRALASSGYPEQVSCQKCKLFKLPKQELTTAAPPTLQNMAAAACTGGMNSTSMSLSLGPCWACPSSSPKAAASLFCLNALPAEHRLFAF